MSYTVYCLTLPNGKRYVGQTGRNVEDRWNKGYGYVDNPPLFDDIIKFGWENVGKTILAVVDDKKSSLDEERRYIQEYGTIWPNGYNRETKSSMDRVKIERDVFDEFLINLNAFLDFKPTEGMKMKVFIHCILVSERSNPETGSDGNVFKVQRVVKSVMKEMPEVSDTAVRMHISRLAKDGFVIPTDIRGEYYINPKYGIKGTITEKTFLELTVVKNPKDSVCPNEDFEKGGNDGEHATRR